MYPIVRLTVTATAQVRKDVVDFLRLSEAKLKVFTITTSRKKLYYNVRFKSGEEDHHLDFLGWLKGSVHRRRTEDVNR